MKTLVAIGDNVIQLFIRNEYLNENECEWEWKVSNILNTDKYSNVYIKWLIMNFILWWRKKERGRSRVQFLPLTIKN